MSSGLRKHQSKQQQIKKPLGLDTKADCYKDSLYYPFSNRQPNYYYDYVYPYPQTSYPPFFGAPYLPPFHHFAPKVECPVAQLEDRDQRPITPTAVKTQMIEQKNFLIKIQDDEAEIQQFQAKQETIKSEEKKNKKQLYLMDLDQELSNIFQQEMNNLFPKFKTIIEGYIEQNAEQQSFIKAYEVQFAKQIKQNKSFFEELMAVLKRRFKNFKKTKEQLIKFIIRRTYHNLKINKNLLFQKPEYQRLETFHQKNLATFKSMNIQFLKKEFSNQLFVQLFKDFVSSLEDQFEIENQEKVDRLALTLVSCWIKKSTNLLMHQRKLPWVNTNKLRIKKIALELLKQYEVSMPKDCDLSKCIKK